MKEKIETALKTKYSHLGFSAKAISGVAESLAATGLVADENLAAIVEGQKSTLVAMQSEIDSRVTSAVEKAKADAIKPPATGGEQPKIEPTAFDGEAFKKQLFEEFKQTFSPLQEKIQCFEAAQAAARRSADIAAAAKKFGIPEAIVAKLSITEDANLDDYMKVVKQDFANMGFEFAEPPAEGSGASTNGSDVANLINQGTKEIVEQKK